MPIFPITILTGAGISAESGLETFRASDGTWARHDVNEVATPEGFGRNPALVHEFYNMRRRDAAAAQPNAAHLALARLQAARPGQVHVITQNVDDLHERAGSNDVIHMHGSLRDALCADCGARWPAPLVMRPQDACRSCGQQATRPDIVWFGEIPYHMPQIYALTEACGLFVVIGSAGQVYPAAGLAALAHDAGAARLEFNLARTGGGFEQGHYGPAGQTVPLWVDALLASDN